MQKKTKKRLVITGIVAAVLIGGLLLGYAAVNMAFSMIGDSFYRSDVAIGDTPQEAAEGEKLPEQGESEASGEAGQAGTSTQNSGGTASGDETPSIPFDKLNLSAEEFKALQKKVPFNDKIAALNILSTGLSAEDYTELIGMLSGGISSSEVKRAYQIVSRGLSSEDKEKIWGYYYKYKHLIQ